jgi:hypothetical protein
MFMTIVTPDGPVDGVEVVKRAVADLRDKIPLTSEPHQNLAVTRPLQAYSLTLNDIKDAQFPNAAIPNDWRYIVFGDQALAVVEVSTDTEGKSSFKSLDSSKMAQHILRAATIAAQRFGATQDRYEARLLEIAPIRVLAFWLHGVEDVFLPISSYERGTLESIAVDLAFTAGVVRAANARRSHER